MGTRFVKALFPATAFVLTALGCGGKAPPAYDQPPVLANREEITAAMAAVGAGLEARVVLQVHVDRRGYVRDAYVAHGSGSQELDDAAMWIGEQMRFDPAMHQGQPVAAWVQVPVVFDVVSSVVRAPRIRNAPEVAAVMARDYPDLRGSARVSVEVGPEGWVREIKERSSTDREVMAAALDLLDDWVRFHPGYKEGRELSAWVNLTFQFSGERSRVYIESAET